MGELHEALSHLSYKDDQFDERVDVDLHHAVEDEDMRAHDEGDQKKWADQHWQVFLPDLYPDEEDFYHTEYKDVVAGYEPDFHFDYTPQPFELRDPQHYAEDHYHWAEPHYEEPHYDVIHYEEPHYEVPHYDVVHYEEPHYEVPHYDVVHYEAPRYDGPQYEGAHYQGPHFEGPHYEMPQSEGYYRSEPSHY